MTVKVEQKHIRGATIKSSCDCPIARALREQHPRQGVWYVFLDRACLFPGGSYPLPEKAMEFMNDMLQDKPVKPFVFDM